MCNLFSTSVVEDRTLEWCYQPVHGYSGFSVVYIQFQVIWTSLPVPSALFFNLGRSDFIRSVKSLAICKTNIQRLFVSFLYIWKSSSKELCHRVPSTSLIIFRKSLTSQKAWGPLHIMWRGTPACGLVFGLAYLPANYWQQESWWWGE